jgi:hypothetical protein
MTALRNLKVFRLLGCLVVWLFLLLTINHLPLTTYAQVRGDGVGALATRTSGNSLVTVTNGRTAPWAEVIVENGSGDVVAVAELDNRGIFNFSFYTDSTNLDNLYLYAVDEAGITNNIRLTSSNQNNFILPPTLVGVNETALPDTTLSVYGFAYPGSIVTVSLTSVEGYSRDFTITPDTATGRWELEVPGLAAGEYTAIAQAAVGALESSLSQEITFTISALAVIVPVAQIGQTVTETVKELPTPVKQTAEIISKATPIATIWYLLQLLYSWLSGIFVGRKRKEKWGVLYDAVTKNPVARGIVRLYNRAGVLVETDVTGTEGVFSFFPPPGFYKIDVRKPNYSFPSKLVTGKRDGEYAGLYYGEEFEITQANPVVSLSIPVDPRVYEKLGFTDRLRRFLTRYSDLLGWLLFVPGFVFSLIVAILRPVTFNIIVIFFYILTILLMFIRSRRRARMWGEVTDTTGQLQPGIALTLLDSVFNRQLQRRVTDNLGRYQFIVPPGSYYIAVTSPEFELVKERGSYTGEKIETTAEKGVIKPKIKVRPKSGR